ncbi:ABC transporter permease [Blastococcus saxobsidens]|uniref:Xylose transport system permease protein XylH n=1 Tax=Blastococcus saxobsidens TaxID=138336 RepID=A0A4Q7YBD2_9ACTN|nr:ribose ABC transporter permease [Blastococcus saxobsidens]RZU33469.1 simple sugar transport system permease protein [Blastococcus saxobsidens]
MSDRLPAFGTVRAAGSSDRRFLTRALARPSLPAAVGLVVVVAFFSLQAPALRTVGGLATVLDVAASLGIGAVAVALLLIAGQFDLSVGVMALASSLLSALLIGPGGWPVWPALTASLLAALLVGVVNGVLVVNTGLPSFLVTVATFLVLQGTALAGFEAFAGSTQVRGLDSAQGWSSAAAVFGSFAEIGAGRFHVALLWWLGATALATWALWRTRFGNAVFAAGGARQAARELGVPVRRTTVALFCLTATAGWLIGTLGLFRLESVQLSNAGLGTGLDFVIVAVIGGCLLTGGYGSAVGAAVGALLYAVARQGITLAGWDPRWFQVFLGAVLLVALLTNGVVRRRLKARPRS